MIYRHSFSSFLLLFFLFGKGIKKPAEESEKKYPKKLGT